MKKFLFFIMAILIGLSCSSNENRTKNQSTTINNSEKNLVDTPAIPEPITETKPVYKVYIENSGSMDGYVKGVTEFEQAIYNYLQDIQISSLTDSLCLFFINNKIILQGSDVEDFIQKLEPATFRARGGNRGSTDIADILKMVINENDTNDVSIMITDGIFSPGRGVNANEYLVNQQIGIKGSFANYLKTHPSHSVIIYKLESKFEGIFYDKVDNRINISENRPYYLWIIGDVNHLKDLRNKIGEEKLKERSAENKLDIYTVMNGNQIVDYRIHPSFGKFDKKRISKNEIIKLKKDTRGGCSRKEGLARFAVNIDFSPLLLDGDYLLDTENYANSSNYELEIKESNTANYTHTLFFSSNRISLGEVVVKLKANTPNWVIESNDDEGVAAVKHKTYGIKFQVEGVNEAFTFDNDHYAEIKINIK